MANIVYKWNPFQTLIDNRIPAEPLRVNSTDLRKEFPLRFAPFFSKNFQLFQQGSVEPLRLGIDYAFAHPFEKFILDYKRNCFGSVVLLKKIEGTLLAAYDTLGSPLALDDAAYAVYIANLVNSDRMADWADLVDVPTEWPADPHEQPITQTYDYLEMMTALKSLIAISSSTSGAADLRSLFEEHINEPLVQAHAASKGDFSLGLVQNMPPAKTSDLAGNSNNKVVTIDVLKDAIRQNNAGILPLN